MSNATLFALILAAVIAVNRIAAPSEAHEAEHVIPFKVAKVYDGDTIMGTAHLWPGLSQYTAVRVRGIDTPELRGGCEESKALAVLARTLTDSLVKTAYQVSLVRPQQGKYSGRVVADVMLDDRNLGALLVERGLAREYDGKTTRPDWCDDTKGGI